MSHQVEGLRYSRSQQYCDGFKTTHSSIPSQKNLFIFYFCRLCQHLLRAR